MPKIYVVDDDKRLAKIASDNIGKSTGFESRFFDNPLMALGASIEEPPDLMIVDMMMPSMDGISLVRELRKADVMCHVIILTGYKATVLTKVLPTNNISAILEKPYTIPTLINAVKSAMDQQLVAH